MASIRLIRPVPLFRYLGPDELRIAGAAYDTAVQRLDERRAQLMLIRYDTLWRSGSWMVLSGVSVMQRA